MADEKTQAIERYIQKLDALYRTGIVTEHSYRPALQELLEALLDDPKKRVINEPRRIQVGAPDFGIVKDGVALGYVEAKDLGRDLDDKTFQSQLERYIAGLDNLVVTNYIRFRFYHHGKLVEDIEIARIDGGRVVPVRENFKRFADLLGQFFRITPRTITSPERLARLMADKARLLQQILYNTLKIYKDLDAEGAYEYGENELYELYKSFKIGYIAHITIQEFSDIYAQTIAYGFFIARYHDETLEDFSRAEARHLIPSSHPFLKELFKYVSDDDRLDERLVWVVDSLADIFKATDVRRLFEKSDKDPMIHFYETFLSYYNPEIRERRGVWYTPKEVVDFIVRSVDLVLKEHFGLEGLVDESMVTIAVPDPDAKRRKDGTKPTKPKRVHKVQILDPATGTGTFLASVVEQIAKEFIPSWADYVEDHLIPRLNGFELLMASYAMAHLKLDMMLSRQDYSPQRRIRVFLTNSLEPPHKEYQNLLFAEFTRESREADRIKKEMPLFVIIGNPPYSGHSANKNEWIDKLLEEYKKEPDGSRLKERNPKWLNDDYVKFIRLAQYYIDRTGEGVVGYITAHGFLDNPTFRGMRYSLLKSFDEIYILNLHGNARKKERAPDGSKDENVFDIMQGVSINLFVKHKEGKGLARVRYADLWGTREHKYSFLDTNDISTIAWQDVTPREPMYFFVPRDYELEDEYRRGFGVTELFGVYSAGVVTAKDQFLIDFDPDVLKKRIESFFTLGKDEIVRRFGLREKSNFQIDRIKNECPFDERKIVPIDYRPFDHRFIYYDECMVERSRIEVMRHFLNKENLGLVFCKQVKASKSFHHIFISDAMIESSYISNKTGEINYLAPLYIYTDTFDRSPNFRPETLERIEASLGLRFGEDFDEVHLFDYIYAILHHPIYRERYFEFLKSDFPRIPYPVRERFFTLADFGRQLRELHLLRFTPKRVVGWEGQDFTIATKLGKKDITPGDPVAVRLNDTTTLYVPKVAWEFYVGGYQPAQKWLKDRKGRKLGRKELAHYNHFVDALMRTDALMRELAGVEWR